MSIQFHFQVIEMFKECKIEDMPPHIYTVAATAHRDMLLSRKDQSIVLMGRSGSGKTVNLKHVLHYFAVSTNKPKSGLFTPDCVQAISTLLEAFGNTRTIINANATRFSSLFSIDFDPSGQIASASLQTMLLEKSRVVRRPDGEPNFNIFYQMLAGLDTQTRLELHLDNLSDPNLFMTPLSRVRVEDVEFSLEIIGVLRISPLDIYRRKTKHKLRLPGDAFVPRSRS